MSGTKRLLWTLAFSLALFGCHAPEVPRIADREEVALEMPLLAEYETRRGQLRNTIGYMGASGMLASLDAEALSKIKEAWDTEYVYYHAAVVALAEGRFPQYRAYVALAQKELDRITEILRRYLTQL